MAKSNWILKISKNRINIRTRTLLPPNNRIVDKTVKYALKIPFYPRGPFLHIWPFYPHVSNEKNWLWIKRYPTKKWIKRDLPTKKSNSLGASLTKYWTKWKIFQRKGSFSELKHFIYPSAISNIVVQHTNATAEVLTRITLYLFIRSNTLKHAYLNQVDILRMNETRSDRLFVLKMLVKCTLRLSHLKYHTSVCPAQK